MDTPAFVFDLLNKQLLDVQKDMLTKISIKYNIDIDDLTKEFLGNLNIVTENVEKVVIFKKQKPKDIPKPESRCTARVWNRGKGGQCTRHGSPFCKQHTQKRKHGLITDPPPMDIFSNKSNTVYK
jgi:hypothetical protein